MCLSYTSEFKVSTFFDRHLGWLYFLAVVSSAAISTNVQLPLGCSDFKFFTLSLISGMTKGDGSSNFRGFWENSILVSTVDAKCLNCTIYEQVTSFPKSLLEFVGIYFLDDSQHATPLFQLLCNINISTLIVF